MYKKPGRAQTVINNILYQTSLNTDTHTHMYRYPPCWSRWSLRPLCHKVFPPQGRRLNTDECRPSPSPHSPSPLCTPSSVCRSSPGERSGRKVQRKMWRVKMNSFVEADGSSRLVLSCRLCIWSTLVRALSRCHFTVYNPALPTLKGRTQLQWSSAK